MSIENGSKLCDKIIQLRREKGLSQEQLADYLDVSRQAVSKWESDQSMPSLDKIIQLSDLFGVSIDYLVRENAVNEEKNKTVVTTTDDTLVMEQLNELKDLVKSKRLGTYEYKSKTCIGKIPLVHVKFAYGKPAVAKGIIAIGNISCGVISIGGLSAGLISMGGLSLGLLLALGGISLGGIALGGVAVGILASGGLAVGMYAFGGCAIASEIASGGYASGNIAIGDAVNGNLVFERGTATAEQVRLAIMEQYPHIPKILAKILAASVK